MEKMFAKKVKIVSLVIVILLIVGFFALRNFTFKQPTGMATLTWDANTEEDLTGYKIYYGTEPRKGDCPKDGKYAKSVKVGNVTTYRIENLNPGATYYFSITSANTAGKESCFSPEMKKEIALDATGKMDRLAKFLHLQ